MPRPSVAEKADALLEEPDRIARVAHDEVEAYKVQGNGGLYFVIVEQGKVEACTCPAGQFGVRCYHATAVEKMLKS